MKLIDIYSDRHLDFIQQNLPQFVIDEEFTEQQEDDFYDAIFDMMMSGFNADYSALSPEGKVAEQLLDIFVEVT